ncbi:Pro-kumamolisin, activation domain [Carpediemonas membranifera]|uniref:Pro-kumamolisin, activation domain n=1 Tax=Carpediemonas membranifera TaxID=201153 RepID=A0A8J6E2C1_9EUKA|nr:Pro-kumamolisin, activation domain [Carpediemonas membranifera]|eukprot:KAG9394508.1 Pro-kumamolisin, activation domain [Carpediemonas membranifera]
MTPTQAHIDSYVRVGDVSEHHVVNVSFALKPTDYAVQRLDQELVKRSDPSSPLYGHWMSDADITTITSSPHLKPVMNWAKKTFPTATVTSGAMRDVVHVRTTVGEINKGLSTTFGAYLGGERTQWAVGEYHMPEDIAAHVQTVAGLHHLPPVKAVIAQAASNDASPTVTGWNAGGGRAQLVFKPVCTTGTPTVTGTTLTCTAAAAKSVTITLTAQKAAAVDTVTPANIEATVPISDVQCYSSAATVACMAPVPAVIPEYVRYTPSLVIHYVGGVDSDESTCSLHEPLVSSPWTLPHTLKKAYSVPAGLKVTTAATQAIVGFFDQFFNQTALTEFLQWNGLKDNVLTVHGAIQQSNPGGEASLDVQYITGIATQAETHFYSISSLYQSNEDFMSWLLMLAEDKKRPLVHSISYEDEEGKMDAAWRDKVNYEFKKLTLAGTTFVGGSGDDGAANFGIRTAGTAQCSKFEPGFPCSSPYVLCVSATQLDVDDRGVFQHKKDALPFRPGHGKFDGVGSDVEVACSSDRGARITTGGGFSGAFERPSYQDSEVRGYLSTATLPTIGQWNKAGRGYPDVSTIGHNYLINMPDTPFTPKGLELLVVDGTSASTPVMAGLVTLLNDARLRHGLSSMGFINPWLYETSRTHPECFVDIVTGNNRCGSMGSACCPQGFEAAPGWDSVTGLGTPVWECLRDVAIGSPESTSTTEFPLMWRIVFAFTLVAVIGVMLCNAVIGTRVVLMGRKGARGARDNMEAPLLG